MQDERDKVDGIVVIPEQSEKYLNQRQLEDHEYEYLVKTRL